MSTNKTLNYELNQWELNDKPIMDEFNEDNRRVDEALGDKMNNPVKILEGADLNEYTNVGFYFMPANGSSIYNIPINDSTETQGFALLVQKTGSNGGIGITQILTTHQSGKIYVRTLSVNAEWIPWVSLSTATNSEEYKLSFETPLVGTTTFYKTQEGEVTINMDFSTIDSNAFAEGTMLIGRLPEGFRPRIMLLKPLTTNTNIVGQLQININGLIYATIKGISRGSTALIPTISYLAK